MAWQGKVEILLGHKLRPKQNEVFQLLLDNQSVFAVLPTSYGKSILFGGFPTAYEEMHPEGKALTLIISPLNALMYDQVENWNSKGIKAIALRPIKQMKKPTVEAVKQGEYQLMFAAPEIIQQQGWWKVLKNIRKDIKLLAFDEGHLISRWGKKFRPDYLRSLDLRGILCKSTVLVVTATATQNMISHIATGLGLTNMKTVALPADRPEIFLKIVSAGPEFEESFSWYTDLLRKEKEKTPRAIIFSRTYDSCEIKPGPHLNMVIGPNTSGKSSIVCAICLGLGGKPSFLARANSPAEYIKHGEAKAVIEITLFNPHGEHHVIKREISRPNRSEWAIGGRPATQKSVEELVLSLNIQMGNLCQFLPQDKVADFAKMSQQELLENTEKAAGPIGMYENHLLLKSAREKSRTLENSVKTTSDVLDREKQKNQRLETEVKNYQARQKHLEQIKILKMKRTWLVYEEKRKEYQEVKKRKEQLQEELKKDKSAHAPLRREIDQTVEKIKEENVAIKKHGEVVQKHARVAAEKSKAIEKEGDAATEAADELNSKKQQEQRRRQKLRELKEHLKQLEDGLSKVVEERGLLEELEQVKRDMTKSSHEMNGIMRRGEAIQTEIRGMKQEIAANQNQLKRLQDQSNQRLEMLRHKHKDTYEAVRWLRANKDKFKSTIHEPLMLIINVHRQEFSKYVENHISFNDMKAFVCEDPADMEVFLKAVRDEQKLQVNAVMAPKESLDSFRPNMAIDHLKHFGFSHYLKDLFDCPRGAMAYLCKLYSVHNVPVGNDYTKQNVQLVTTQLPQLSRFYTTNHSYTIKRSRYSGSISTRCTEIKKATLLTVIIDDQREKALKKALNEMTTQLVAKETEYRAMQATHRDLEKQMDVLRQQKKELNEKKNMSMHLKQKIRTKQENIARNEAEAIDLSKEEETCRKKTERINAKKLKLMKDLRDNTGICQNASFDKVRASLRQAGLVYRQKALENDIRERSQALQAKERQFEQAKEQLSEVKDAARRLLLQAHEATGTKQDEGLSPEMNQAFEILPNTVEDIDASIHQETARAECTYNTDERVVEEYNKRKKEIGRQQNELVSRQDALERHQAEIEKIKAEWIGPLRDLIRRIDNNFSKFFSSMKCAGEVDLNVPENPEDYEKYGVRIKVKYRDNEQLRELTPHHQSGGERSVATVLYMMSLQELTKCPFRCVDEINQGMDPQNERKVFELVVATACREDTSQYFLLTPKLLPDLEYGDRMTILCVYNGPGMVDHQEWALKKFIRRRLRIQAPE